MPQSKNRVDSKSTKNAPAASSSATNKPRQIEKQTLPKDGNKTAENLDSDVPEVCSHNFQTLDFQAQKFRQLSGTFMRWTFELSEF